MKHKVWSAMRFGDNEKEILETLNVFGVDIEYLEKYKNTFPSDHFLKTEKGERIDLKK